MYYNLSNLISSQPQPWYSYSLRKQCFFYFIKIILLFSKAKNKDVGVYNKLI